MFPSRSDYHAVYMLLFYNMFFILLHLKWFYIIVAVLQLCDLYLVGMVSMILLC